MASLTRRSVLLGIGAAASAAVVAACSSSTPAAPTPPATQPAQAAQPASTTAPAASAAPSQKGVTKLVYWTFMPTKPRFQERPALFAEFGKQHNATIEVDDVDAGNPFTQKLSASFAAHLGPDLVDPDTSDRTVQWGQQGFLMSVNGLINQIGRDDFPPVALKFGTWKGKLYGIPLLGYPHIMHYRSDWLSEAGLKPPTTQAELVAAATKLNNASTNPPRYGFAGYFASVHAPFFFQNFVGPNDGYTFDKEGNVVIDSEQVFQSMQTVKDLVPNFEPGYTNLSYGDTRNLFVESKIAIEIDSTSMAVVLIDGAKTHPDVEKNVHSQLIPWGPSSKHDRSGFNGITYFAIGSQTKDHDLCREFMKWFYSKPIFTRAFLSYDWGLIPERISVATDPNWLNKVPKTALEIIKAGTAAAKLDTFPGEDWGPSPAANELVAADLYRNLLTKISQAKSDADIKSTLQWAKQQVIRATKKS